MINNSSNAVTDRNRRENHAATLSKCCLEAFLQAWEVTCTRTNCMSGAHEVSLLSDKNFENHQFCRQETDDEIRMRKQIDQERERKNLYISNCVITDKFSQIKDALVNGPFSSLCLDLSSFNDEKDLVSFVINEAKKHGSYLIRNNFQYGNENYSELILSTSE